MRITRALLMIGLLAGMASTAYAQNVSASPTYGDVRLDAGFLPDPHTVSLTAGGSIEVNVGNCSYGMVASAPDVDLYYNADGGRTLYIWVESSDDTTLLINLPDGTWVCNDDGFGNLNPIVTVPKAASGLYDIWVGTYGDEMTSATLYISEINPNR